MTTRVIGGVGVGGEEGTGSSHESNCGDGFFVGQVFGVGQARVPLDGTVQVHVSGPDGFVGALGMGAVASPA